jgi:1-pyrroline-5-carboxylate dehydrogenase
VQLHSSLCLHRQVADYFARLVQRVAPKHYAQAMAEVTVTRLFLENFSGDQVLMNGLQSVLIGRSRNRSSTTSW